MKTFAYRNPLRDLEHLPFDEAIRQGQHLLGGNGYLPNEDYRDLYRDGRISEETLTTALHRIVRRSEPQAVTIGNRHIAFLMTMGKFGALIMESRFMKRLSIGL